jgi:hypothetical protein
VDQAAAQFHPEGWSTAALALPQHRQLAAAPGLQQYLQQLHCRRELEQALFVKHNASRLDAALDKMGGPALEAGGRVNPLMRKGTSHYRPHIPKALL